MSDTSLVFALSTRNDTADGMRDARQTVQRESEAMADDVGESGSGAATRFGDALKGGVAAAMAGVGALVVQGFADALDQGQIIGKLRAQLGATPAEAKRYGEIAGNLYSSAITEDFQGAADAIKATMGSGLVPPDATNAQIESISTKVSDLATTFDQDLGGVVNAVSQLVRTGLAANADEAFDILTAGFQSSANKADDLVDTLNEYSTQFKKVGLDGETAIGLMNQAIKAGARDSDNVADAIKEFSLRAVDGSKTTADAFKQLGINADDFATRFGKGGKSAQDALDEVFDKLRTLKGADWQNVVSNLFGGPGEDLGKSINAIDVSKAVDSLGDVKGAADEMGDALRDNAGTKVEQFKRGLQQGLVDFLGGTVIPAIDDVKKHASKVFGGLWDDAGKNNEEGVDRVMKFFELLGQRLQEKAEELVPKAIQALTGFGQKVADYIVANPETVLKIGAIATALALAIITLPFLVAGALATAATLMIGSFTQKMIAKLNEKLPEWWNAFVQWHVQKAQQVGGVLDRLGGAIATWFSGLWSRYIAGPVSRQWTSFIGSVQKLPGRAVGALSSLGSQLAGQASRSWQSFWDAASRKVGSFLGWVRGLPGRISSGVGSLKGLLYSKGRDVVTGLWNGITSMGGWLYSKVAGFVSRNVVSAATNLLHIGSPSKLMADEVGHWIPAGVAMGVENNAGVVDEAMQGMVKSGMARPAAGPIVPGAAPLMGASAGGGVVRVVVDTTGADGDFKKFMRKIVRVEGRGNVQVAFGQGQ